MIRNRLTEVFNTLENAAQGEFNGRAGALPTAAPSYSYVFGQDRRCRIAVANTRETRRKAWHMVYSAYKQINYVNAHPSELRVVLHDAWPATTTFLIEDGVTGLARATFTLTPDNPFGLPLESYYSAEVQALRQAGRKPCEISKLVACSLAAGDQPGIEVLLNAFKLAYLTARRLEACTDFVVAVVPRHVPYYQRFLLFEPLGAARSYDSLNGLETVPLRLDLVTAEERYSARFGNLPGARNLYNFFVNAEEPRILDWLRRERRRMSAADFRHFFMEETRIYQEAKPEDRLVLRNCYLEHDFDPALVAHEE